MHVLTILIVVLSILLNHKTQYYCAVRGGVNGKTTVFDIEVGAKVDHAMSW